MQISIENKADIVECNFMKFETPLELKKLPTSVKKNTEIFTAENALELLMKEYLKQVVWNKIYRKEVVSNFQFPTGRINEDEYWTYKVFGNAKKIVRIQEVLYFYRQQQNSISGKKYSLQRLDAVDALEERISYMKENFPKLENLATRIFCFAAMSHYEMINEHQAIDPKKIYRKEIVQKIKKYNQFSVLKNWEMKTVFWYKFFLISPNTSLRCRKYSNKVRNLD